MITIVYPPELPVSARREDIAAAIRDNQVVIVSGETGSGKTTQLPKIALELGREQHRAHPAAPHRCARRRGARRRRTRHRTWRRRGLPGAIHGPLVQGHPAQGHDRRHPARPDPARSPVARLRHDHHRRGPRAQPQHRLPAWLPHQPAPPPPATSSSSSPRRPSTPSASASTSTPPSSRSRAAPTPWRSAIASRTTATSWRESCARARNSCAEGHGDILVFLSGEREIATRPTLWPGWRPAPPGRARSSCFRCTRASVPRSSTACSNRIPDAGSCWQQTSPRPRSRFPAFTTSLTPAPRASRGIPRRPRCSACRSSPSPGASANQRAGRAGRLADGIAIRLYSRRGLRRPARVHRTGDPAHLARVRAAAHDRVGVASSPDDVAQFPVRRAAGHALDPRRREPAQRTWRLNRAPKLTAARPPSRASGGRLPQLPMDPRQARMVVEAGRHGVAREVAIIAAALSHSGPARAAARAARGGGPAAQAVRGSHLRPALLPQPVALHPRAAARALRKRVPAPVQVPNTSITCAFANGRTSWSRSAARRKPLKIAMPSLGGGTGRGRHSPVASSRGCCRR